MKQPSLSAFFKALPGAAVRSCLYKHKILSISSKYYLPVLSLMSKSDYQLYDKPQRESDEVYEVWHPALSSLPSLPTLRDWARTMRTNEQIFISFLIQLVQKLYRTYIKLHLMNSSWNPINFPLPLSYFPPFTYCFCSKILPKTLIIIFTTLK